MELGVYVVQKWVHADSRIKTEVIEFSLSNPLVRLERNLKGGKKKV